MGAAWTQDAYSQTELCLYALKLAAEFLAPEGACYDLSVFRSQNFYNLGTFITKIFRSQDYNAFYWVCTQLFQKVLVVSVCVRR
jgi:AdoMet-dependent rRNA methyltransferase SPB1